MVERQRSVWDWWAGLSVAEAHCWPRSTSPWCAGTYWRLHRFSVVEQIGDQRRVRLLCACRAVTQDNEGQEDQAFPCLRPHLDADADAVVRFAGEASLREQRAVGSEPSEVELELVTGAGGREHDVAVEERLGPSSARVGDGLSCSCDGNVPRRLEAEGVLHHGGADGWHELLELLAGDIVTADGEKRNSDFAGHVGEELALGAGASVDAHVSEAPDGGVS